MTSDRPHVRSIETNDLPLFEENAPLIASFLGRGVNYLGVAPSGEIIAAGGVVPLHPGVAHGWFALGSALPEFRVWAVRTVKSRMIEACKAFAIHRLQTPILATEPKHAAFCEALGFTREGLMRSFGSDGADYFLYARVKG